MNLENHERAKKLLAAVRVEGISPGESRWLDTHLAGCSECSNEAHAVAFAIESLRAFSVIAGPDVVRRTSLAVQRRAEQRRDERERSLPIWIAAATSSVWMIMTTPYTWSAFAWLGRMLNVSAEIWQIGFLMWWFLPATVLSAVAGWQHVARRNAESNWVTEMNRR